MILEPDFIQAVAALIGSVASLIWAVRHYRIRRGPNP